MSGKLVVPSDITLLEEKYAVGKRRLRFFERTGLLGIAPMWHIRYSKNSTSDLRDVLRKRYDKNATEPAVEVIKRRQESIRKQVVAHNGLWGGIGTFSGLALWSLRRYNWQTKSIVLPFIAYAGAWIGRLAGDLMTFRVCEFGEDRFLGSLPARQFYTSESSAEE